MSSSIVELVDLAHLAGFDGVNTLEKALKRSGGIRNILIPNSETPGVAFHVQATAKNFLDSLQKLSVEQQSVIMNALYKRLCASEEGFVTIHASRNGSSHDAVLTRLGSGNGPVKLLLTRL